MKDWDDYRYVLAVARTGSIRAAAAALGVNHSTVSRRIDAFEARLQVRLFERLPTGYFMTGTGEEMAAFARRIEAETLAASRLLAGREARLSGTLRVTMPNTIAVHFAMPDLVRFSDEHPEISLELDVTLSMADLARREADVAIRVSNDPPGNLVGRRLLRYARAIYASEGYLSRHDSARPRSAAGPGMTWIGWDDTVPDPQWVRQSPYPDAPARNRISNTLVHLEAAKCGMGICMLPCFVGDTEPTLRRLPPGTPEPDRDIWLLTHEDLRHTARVRRFLDFMAEAILARRDLLEGRCPFEPD